MCSQVSGQIPVSLSEKELVELYFLLKKQELRLQGTMYNLLLRLEKILYATLTIEELENLKKQSEVGE